MSCAHKKKTPGVGIAQDWQELRLGSFPQQIESFVEMALSVTSFFTWINIRLVNQASHSHHVTTHYKLIRYGGRAGLVGSSGKEDAAYRREEDTRQRLLSNFNSSADEMRGAKRWKHSLRHWEADIKVITRLWQIVEWKWSCRCIQHSGTILCWISETSAVTEHAEQSSSSWWMGYVRSK